LVLIFPFIAKAQAIDFSTSQTNDSYIVKRKVFVDVSNNSANEPDSVFEYQYTVNGKEISDSELKNLLYIFPSSRHEYMKYEETPRLSFLFDVVYPTFHTPLLTFSIALMTSPVTIPLIISANYHYHYAIKLYNEEILKRHQ